MKQTLALLSLSGVVLSSVVAQAQNANPQPLSRSSKVERTIGGSESHAYSVRAAANQILKVVVEQRGSDVVVHVRSPRGAELLRVDGPTGDQGAENVTWNAAESGNYEITVTPLEKDAKPGKYEIQLTDQREMTRQEREQVRAEAELRPLVAAWAKAVVERNVDELRRLASRDFTQHNAFLENPLSNFEEYVQRVTTVSPQARSVTRERVPETMIVRAYGSTAQVTGRMAQTVMQGGVQSKNSVFFAHLWRKQDGRWLLAHEELFLGRRGPEPGPAVSVPAEVLQAYVGRYRDRFGGVLIIERVGDHLAYGFEASPGFRTEIYPQTEADFRDDVGGLLVTFVRNAKGEVTHLNFVPPVGPVRYTRLP